MRLRETRWLPEDACVWRRRAWQIRRLLISGIVFALFFLVVSIGAWALLAEAGQHDPVDKAALLGVVAGAVAALAALLVVPRPKSELSADELAEESRKLAGRLLNH